jgi:hypothetical protein
MMMVNHPATKSMTTRGVLLLLLAWQYYAAGLSFQRARYFSRPKTTTFVRTIRLQFSTAASDLVEAEDLPSVQALFNKYCDEDGLMSKEELEAMSPFAEMLVSSL